MVHVLKRLFLLTAGIFSAALFAEGRTETKPVYNMPVEQSVLKEWKSTNPAAVSVGYLPQGGQEGKGALSIRILKPGNGIVEVNAAG